MSELNMKCSRGGEGRGAVIIFGGYGYYLGDLQRLVIIKVYKDGTRNCKFVYTPNHSCTQGELVTAVQFNLVYVLPSK